jgi:hypothetical protein
MVQAPTNTDPTKIQPSNIECDCFGSCGPASASPRPKRSATRKRKADQHPDEPPKKKTAIESDSSTVPSTTTASINVAPNFVRYFKDEVVEKYLEVVSSLAVFLKNTISECCFWKNQINKTL